MLTKIYRKSQSSPSFSYENIVTQARNQLGTTRGAKSFLRGTQFYELCPIVSNYIHGGRSPSAPPMVTGLLLP